MDELRMLLDGEAQSMPNGFHCETAERRMFVPFSITRCPATALLVCRQSGLLKEKLAAMELDAAHLPRWRHRRRRTEELLLLWWWSRLGQHLPVRSILGGHSEVGEFRQDHSVRRTP